MAELDVCLRLVLLVEDQPDLRQSIEGLLRLQGYRVNAVADGDSAFVCALDERPDVVLTDIDLGHTNGLDLITRIRAEHPRPPPIIATSGFPGYEPEALHRGAVQFIEKPIDIEGLLAVLAAAVREEPISPAQLADIHRRSMSLRERALRLSEAALARLFTAQPSMRGRGGVTTRWLAGHIGQGAAVMVLLEGGALRVHASSDERRLPAGAPADDLVPVAQHVLEASSNLVIPDLRRYAVGGRLDFRSFAGVPFIVDDIAVGALCLVGDHVGGIDGEDLSLLEWLGRRAGAALGDPATEVVAFFDDTALLTRAGLELLVSLEMRRRQRAARSLALLAFDVTGAGWRDRIAGAFQPRRAAVGRLGPARHGVLMAREGERIDARELDRVLAALASNDEVRGIGVVSMEGNASGLPEETRLVAWAESLCERSVQSGRQWIEELSMRHGAFPDPRPAEARAPRS